MRPHPIKFVLALVSLTFFVAANEDLSGSVEPFVYVIYHAEDGCQDRPVSVIGVTTDQVIYVVGGRSGEGTCAYEALCFHNERSIQCQYDLERTVSGQSFFHVDHEDRIIECDTTNSFGEAVDGVRTTTSSTTNENDRCNYMEDTCTQSSIYPSCQFEVVTSTTLFKTPGLIKNANAANENALDQLSYMVFYSDPECSVVEGIEGIVAGEKQLAVVDGSYSCQDALRCLFHPEGDYCVDTVDEVSKSTYEVFSQTREKGKNVYRCNDDSYENCVPAPSTCMPSPLPSCHYRWVSAVDLFTDPSALLPKPKTDGEDVVPSPVNSSGGSYHSHDGMTMTWPVAVLVIFSLL